MMLLKIQGFTKMNIFFTQSLPEAVQNHAQNHDFSENPRWEPKIVIFEPKIVRTDQNHQT